MIFATESASGKWSDLGHKLHGKSVVLGRQRVEGLLQVGYEHKNFSGQVIESETPLREDCCSAN